MLSALTGEGSKAGGCKDTVINILAKCGPELKEESVDVIYGWPSTEQQRVEW